MFVIQNINQGYVTHLSIKPLIKPVKSIMFPQFFLHQNKIHGEIQICYQSTCRQGLDEI